MIAVEFIFGKFVTDLDSSFNLLQSMKYDLNALVCLWNSQIIIYNNSLAKGAIENFYLRKTYHKWIFQVSFKFFSISAMKNEAMCYISRSQLQNWHLDGSSKYVIRLVFELKHCNNLLCIWRLYRLSLRILESIFF